MCPTVLIVDDEPDVLQLVEYRLSAEGFNVLTAADGLEGLRKARCDSPDVIVMDMLLPDLDGLAVCDILSAQPSTRDVPVVIFSALDRPSRRIKARVFRWLKKGADFDSLADSLRAAVAQLRQQAE
jgi:two-component system, OmpR family, alkaline phosphatase synthesis response regulator PhoP